MSLDYRHRRGVAMLYVIVMITVLIGFVSLGADWGRVQVAKTELRRAADAAARYGALSIGSGTSTAQANAILAAADNTCDGTAVALTSADIEFGSWDSGTRTFTVLSGAALSSADTIRVTARRTTARGNPISTMFARILGSGTCDVTAVAVAQFNPGGARGFIGLDQASFGSNLWLASYNSDSLASPSHSTYSSKGGAGSNGPITGKTNDEIYGTMFLGPSGSSSGIAVHGDTKNLKDSIPTPDLPTWSPTANPSGVPANYTVNTATTLPAGSYWFTSLTINSSLTFSGAATIYVSGNVAIAGSLTAYNSKPTNLMIYQYGSGTFTDGGANNMILTAKVVCADATFTVKNSTYFAGAGTFKSFNAGNYCDFYYDEALGAAGISSDGGVCLVK